MKTEDRLDRLLALDAPRPSPDFDARFFARLAAEGKAGLDDLLDADRPEPGAGFDARLLARLEAEGGADLDALLDADQPAPGTDFDARFFERFAATHGPGLDDLLDADRPSPGDDFDASFLARLAAEHQQATEPEGAPEPSDGARVLRFRRRWAAIGTAVGTLMAAAAALALWLLPTQTGLDDLSSDELGLLANLELLEVYDELQMLDALEDEATFEMVAQLHTIESAEEGTP